MCFSYFHIVFMHPISFRAGNDGSVGIWTIPQPGSSVKLPKRSSSLTGDQDKDSKRGETPQYPDCSEYTIKHIFTLKGHSTSVLSLAFSPNSLMLSSGCTRGCLNIWSLQDGSLLQTCTNSGQVEGICWYGDTGLAACFNRTKVRWKFVVLYSND